jgi:TPP-dependent pyruvate/acetoin dehydrogenase alpha subunit
LSSSALDQTARPSDRNVEPLALYRKMLLVRLCEETIRQEYFKDDMKTPVHMGIGSEAISVGVMAVLPKTAKAFGTYRNHALYLTVTDDVDGFFAELYGRRAGPGKGKAGSMHLAFPERGLVATSAVVASTIPVAVGCAFAQAYQGSKDLTVSFFGDGAIEEGVFSESLNFACLKRLPILFVCEDNGLAIHTPVNARQGYRSITGIANAYECHTASGDGYDAVEVAALTKQLLARMAEDGKPGFLHLKYFRFLEHVGPNEDFKAGYRPKPSTEELASWDPILRAEERLRQSGISDQEMLAIRKSLQERIDRSVAAAQAAPFADHSELFTDVLL